MHLHSTMLLCAHCACGAARRALGRHSAFPPPLIGAGGRCCNGIGIRGLFDLKRGSARLIPPSSAYPHSGASGEGLAGPLTGSGSHCLNENPALRCPLRRARHAQFVVKEGERR